MLKVVARRLAEHYAGNEISGRISEYGNSLSVQEHLDAREEYIEKFGHLFPPKSTAGNAAQIKINFFKVLEQHPRMLQRLRRVGR